MPRFWLTDAQWAKMEPFCLVKPSDPGRTGSDGRCFWHHSLAVGEVKRTAEDVAQRRVVLDQPPDVALDAHQESAELAQPVARALELA
jgi:hypothetical protein